MSDHGELTKMATELVRQYNAPDFPAIVLRTMDLLVCAVKEQADELERLTAELSDVKICEICDRDTHSNDYASTLVCLTCWNEVVTDRRRLRQIIAEAPHGEDCGDISDFVPQITSFCDCWKSKVEATAW